MKKRFLVSALAMTLALMLLSLSCAALADGEKIGSLSYLNMTEEEDSALSASLINPLVKILMLHGVLIAPEAGLPADETGLPIGTPAGHHYDSLNSMLMGLQSGEVIAIKVPYYTARYLCATNDNLATLEYHPENAVGVASFAINALSDGFSFMMKEENAALRDEFDAQIKAMKADGTLKQLIDEHIVKVSEGGEPAVIAFEEFEGDPIKVAVTGSLPPMDYVAADGTFAGFNTAVLAEIGKRLQKSIKLVQVDSLGRALALSEGTVDVVFWNRGAAESLAERRREKGAPSQEVLDRLMAKNQETMTDEDKAAMSESEPVNTELVEKRVARDTPADTITTLPYFSDFPTLVILK